MSDIGGMDLFTDEELAAWLAISEAGSGIGVKTVTELHRHMGNLTSVWQANRDQLRFTKILTPAVIDKFIERRKEISPEKLLQTVKAAGVTALPYAHPLYPSLLREIYDPPTVLYIKGRLSPDDLRHAVGVVGTRRPTSYGQKMVKEIARGLARSGVTVVSGMAVGIDSFAHRAALEGGGRTLAVLGCGVDICYPSSNRPLYEMLINGEHGAVVSEFFPGTQPDAWRFPARNRIISGLSSGLAVIEGGETSGSLITATLAFQQNREVFALPGRVDSPMSAGPNLLIKQQKAHLLRSYEDILDELRWVAAPVEEKLPNVVELFGQEKQIYGMLSNEPVHFDVLCEKSGLATGELSAALTMLELAGLVTRHPGDWYSREE